MFAHAASGLDEREASISKLFSEWDSAASPGCEVGLIQNGRFVFQRGFGLADLQHGEAIGPDTVFSLASMSKQFTGMAVAMLIREGKLSLDDDVRKYVPELPKRADPIRICDLVYHASGLHDYISLAEDLSDYGRLDRPHTQADFLGLLARQKDLNFAPGTRFFYNNSNYFLLGVIIQRVSRMSLRAFAEQRIFGPLGMRQTRFADRLGETIPHLAIGYDSSGKGRFNPVHSVYDQVGDGGVLTTLNDLARWDAEFYRHSLGGAALHNLSLTTGTLRDGTHLPYAFGLYVDSPPIGERIYHGGSDAGFRTRVARYPAQRFSIFCLCNLSSVNTGALIDKIASVYLGSEAAEHVTPIAVPASELERVQGEYRDPSTMGIWQFRPAGGALAATLLGVPGEKRLVAIGHGEFATANASFLAKFDDSAEAVRISEYHGPPTVFSRVQLAKTPRDLNDYAGAYYSAELDTVYQLAVRNGRLAVISPKAAEGSLSATVIDAFTGAGNYFLFQRGPSGAVTSLRVGENTGRVRNLQLQRMAAP